MDAQETDKQVSPLERLLAIEDIKRLRAKYCRGVDTEDWELFASIFAPDVVVDFRQAATNPSSSNTMFPEKLREGVIEGADKWLALVKHGRIARNEHGSISMHHGHMPEIDVHSPTTASGIWAMEDMVFWPGRKTVHGFGFYYETYIKIGDQWKIASMRLKRFRVAPIAES